MISLEFLTENIDTRDFYLMNFRDVNFQILKLKKILVSRYLIEFMYS